MSSTLPPGHYGNFPYASVAAQAQPRSFAPFLTSINDAQRNNTLLDTPSLLLQAVVIPTDKSAEGQLIECVALPWFEIVELLSRSPSTVHDIDWRKWEEIIAGAYAQQGFEVILTPRSNDKGRDVIATKRGLGSIRFVDQVKAYGPGHLVTADEVRSMLGVLSLDPNVSKGLVTTTSAFAPGIMKDPDLARFMPNRLELKSRDALLEWLVAIAGGRK